MKPFLLDANRFPRFYQGGARIDALRGLPVGAADQPEDWVGSTTTSFGSDAEGLTRLPSGQLLRDAVRTDPEGFLGPGHVSRYGPDPALLVKLLDAGERLPVHSHPSRTFTREHLGLAFGKTEAWVIVEADAGAAVHLGPRTALDAQTLRRWVAEQDAGAMLAALREVPVAPGDAILVPAGTLHAIGAGILLVEVQEPTDLSILVEWRQFGVSTGAEHLQLGWDDALASVDPEPLDTAAAIRRPSPDGLPVEAVLPPAADPFFAIERIRPAAGAAECRASFAVLVVLDGSGVLRTEHGGELALSRGQTCLVPYAAGPSLLEGDLHVLRCVPPHLDH